MVGARRKIHNMLILFFIIMIMKIGFQMLMDPDCRQLLCCVYFWCTTSVGISINLLPSCDIQLKPFFDALVVSHIGTNSAYLFK